MTRVGRRLERVPPEPDLEVTPEGDRDPLQEVDVEAGRSAFETADELPVDGGARGEVLLRPPTSSARRADLAAELETLRPCPAIRVDRQLRSSTPTHGDDLLRGPRLRPAASCLVAE
jgi:hypothetical protein